MVVVVEFTPFTHPTGSLNNVYEFVNDMYGVNTVRFVFEPVTASLVGGNIFQAFKLLIVAIVSWFSTYRYGSGLS